jgi:cell division protein FtsI (penicillin-binding protein 3)
MINNNDRLVVENYDSKFLYKKDKSNLNITFNRIALIFFIFLIVSFIYSIKVFYLSTLSSKLKINKTKFLKKDYRADILDNNGNFLVKTLPSTDIGINPNLVIDKKKFLINLKIIFPNKDFKKINKKINGKKFFYLEKKISQEKYQKIRLLGDKSIIAEEKLLRIYPQKNLFSHIIGQIDDDNNGISGIEKSFNYELKTEKKPLELTVDTDIQYLIREELLKYQEIFQSIGSAAILMNVNSGNLLSMVSLPDFDLNKRQSIESKNYINRNTKGVYELGSVFKTFTVAAGFEQGIIEPKTEYLNLKKRLTCGKFTIREYSDKTPTDLTVEEILIRSGNIGSVRIGQKLGIENFKLFLEKIGVLNKLNFDIEEVGRPISFSWGKCKLATVSYGHGITTTPLQLAKAYSIITNGGFDIQPTLIKKKNKNLQKKRILNEGVSEKINKILRKIVTNKEGTAELANVTGYEVGGKTGTAQKVIEGIYSKEKINTFAAIFPTSKPKYVLIVLLDEPKINKDYIYHYRDGSGFKLKGSPRNTAGWNSVEVAGKIIEKIGPILATKYSEVN